MKRIFTLFLLSLAMCLKAMATSDGPADIITEAPGGTETEFDMFYSGFFYGLEGLEDFEDQVLTTTIVTGDDGCYYFKDLFAFMPGGTWVKGESSTQGVVKIQFPQTIAGGTSDKYGASWQDMEVFYWSGSETEIPKPVADPDLNSITFVIQQDGTWIMDELPEGYSVGVQDYSSDYPEGMWMGFAITAVTYVPSNGTFGPIQPPADLEYKRYSFITPGMGTAKTDLVDFGYRVSIGFDGDDVYIGGLGLDIPSVWVKGRREGNRVILSNNQPMGVMGGVYNVMLQYAEKNPRATGGYALLPEDTEFVLIYDPETDTFTTEDPSIIVVINAGGLSTIKYLQMLEDLEFIYQPEAKGVPRNPWDMSLYLRTQTGGNFDTLDFNLPLISTDGVLLERENMYYRLFIDGEQIEILDVDFDSGVDMWDIPYDFDRYLIVCNRMNTAHEMGIRIDGYETIGIQSVNVWDGVEYAGDVVTIDVANIGVEDLPADTSAEIIREEYYTLDGRRLAAPAKGIVIRRIVKSDGTVEVSKIMLR
ncbi:MAG: hypothetical protein K2F87_02905 [Muribaculaceae bacterium]|nr:hypothetical protein [Muribaculaceae bacterium]